MTLSRDYKVEASTPAERKDSKQSDLLQQEPSRWANSRSKSVVLGPVVRLLLFPAVFIIFLSSWAVFDMDLMSTDGQFGYHLSRQTPDRKAQQLLRKHPLIDGHNDFMILVRGLYGDHIYNASFTKPFEDGQLRGHVDVPRLRQGLVGGAFWSAFIGCPANTTDFSDANYAGVVRATMQQLDLFSRLSSKYPHFFTPPPTSDDALSAFQKHGRLISPIGIEGLHQIGNSPATLRLYHSLGVRYATLTWNCHNIYADAALVPDESGKTGISKPLWHGVSERGRELIYEMNRLGMMVDLAHVSQNTMRDALVGSKKWGGWKGSIAPPIFSHSSAYAICPHPRNVPDDVLLLVKQRSSLVMINFSADFISCVPSNSGSGLPTTYAQNVTLAQVVRHIRHIGELIGYDYVGIGSDFDGIEEAPRGLEDVSKFPGLVAELLRQGVSKRNVIKVVGDNLLRVWREADRVSRTMSLVRTPLEDDVQPYRL